MDDMNYEEEHTNKIEVQPFSGALGGELELLSEASIFLNSPYIIGKEKNKHFSYSNEIDTFKDALPTD